VRREGGQDALNNHERRRAAASVPRHDLIILSGAMARDRR
jgi:hypothetical protein